MACCVCIKLLFVGLSLSFIAFSELKVIPVCAACNDASFYASRQWETDIAFEFFEAISTFFRHTISFVYISGYASVNTLCTLVRLYLCVSLVYTSRRPHHGSRHSPIYALSLSGLIIQSGNVHPNPGPSYSGSFLAEIPLRRLRIVNTQADGHCFINSVCMSLTNYLNVTMSQDTLVSRIHQELINYFNDYKPFLSLSSDRFLSQLDNYLVRKRYNSDVVDIIPLATSTALCIEIVVITGPAYNLSSFLNITPLRSTTQNLPRIIVHLVREHYSVTSCIDVAKPTIAGGGFQRNAAFTPSSSTGCPTSMYPPSPAQGSRDVTASATARQCRQCRAPRLQICRPHQHR